MSEKIPVEAYLTKKVIFLSLRILFWCLLKEGWHLKECLYSEFPLFSVRISHLILSKPGSESQSFKHSPCIFPFPVLCQCGCKAVAQPHRPSQKDTSTESAADVFPPGGVCGHFPLFHKMQVSSSWRHASLSLSSYNELLTSKWTKPLL